ncbi:MAG TPA: zinc ribbon domain-containing protein [Chthoniobacterales bacterium]|nr:zinc ribbon domain-containing protein [Chthoniobacterales bacterium]
MTKTNKNCQSCGMPLKKSPGGGGTNADGTISTIYCSYCYENGHSNNLIGRHPKCRIS